MREIALFSNILPTKLPVYSLIIAMRLLIPYFVRWLDNRPVLGEFWFEYVLQVKLIMLSYLMALVNTRFILFGVLDFKRKYFYARMLRSMLLPTRDKHFTCGNMFPSINLLDAQSISSWMQLRNGMLDLGKKYTERVFLFSSCFILFYGILGVFLGLNYFRIINNNIQPTLGPSACLTS